MTMDGLKEEAKKLVQLLEDPQPGLFTWCDFLNKRLDNIVKARNEGLEPPNSKFNSTGQPQS